MNTSEIIESEWHWRCKWLFIVLKYLSSTLDTNDGWFFRKIEDLCFDTGFTHKSISKYREKLIDAGQIEFKVERRLVNSGKQYPTGSYKILNVGVS